MRKARTMASRVVLTAGILFVSGLTATADPIQITSGSLTFVPGEAPEVTLAGEGFTFEGVAGSGVFPAGDLCAVPDCTAGTTLDLHARWQGLDMTGNATLNGRTFTDVGGLEGDSSMKVEWTGSLPIPSDFTGGILTAPVQFAGEFIVFDNLTGGDVTRINLFGSGGATLTFTPFEGSPGAFRLQSLVYDFGSPAPVPEPASMLLMGTGLAGLAALRRRRRTNA